jgi:RNA polymerase sigma-70 factor (ECF subfamily)
MTSRSVVFAEPVRTAIGAFGGSLKDVPAPALGATAIRAAVGRAGIRPDEVETVVMGNVVQAGTKMNSARQAAVHAGLPVTTSSQEIDWAVWMRAALTGDAGAYRQLLVSLAPHVRAVARSRCRRLGAPEGEVEDLVQEVLLTIHLKRGTWDQSRPIGPWVAAIARNRLIDVLRRRRHITVPIEDLRPAGCPRDLTPQLSTRDIALLGHLKPQQREIVRSISLNGSSIRETADRLQMTEGAVRVTLHRALKALAVFYRSSALEY